MSLLLQVSYESGNPTGRMRADISGWRHCAPALSRVSPPVCAIRDQHDVPRGSCCPAAVSSCWVAQLQLLVPFILPHLFLFFRHRNGDFLSLVKKLESDPMCQRQGLKSFLVLPFQRITRMKLILEVEI